jgi:hypothetical protein
MPIAQVFMSKKCGFSHDQTSSSLVLALTELVTCLGNYWCSKLLNRSLGFSMERTDIYYRFSGRNAIMEFIHLDMHSDMNLLGQQNELSW